MSLEKDTAQLKALFEADTDPFVPADPAEVDSRRSKEQQKLIRLKKDNKKLLGKGPSAWREYPEQAWPIGEREDYCPVCGVQYDQQDYQDERTQDIGFEQLEYDCSNCGSISEMQYRVEREYVGTEVKDVGDGSADELVLPEIGPPTESVKEADDPFVPANPEDVSVRKDAANAANKRADIARREAEDARRDKDWTMSLPPEPVYALIIDQGDESYDYCGMYWYDENDDMYLDADGKWWQPNELEDEIRDDFSGFMPVGVTLKSKQDLEAAIRDIQNVLNKPDSEE